MNEQLMILLMGISIGLAIMYYLLKHYRKIKYRRVLAVAKKGEYEAEILLRNKGFRILSTQASKSFQFEQDGEKIDATVRADLIVEKRGKTYVAEVKTGKQADIHRPNVRRQLFEYQHVFNIDGILFVDMNTRNISEIKFIDRDRLKNDSHAFIFGFLFGICVMICLYLFIV